MKSKAVKAMRLLFVTVMFTQINFAQTVTIGTQVWMVENLNVDRFRNGDLIPEARTNEAWQKAGDNKQPAWCYYDKNPKNGTKYGKLYNWYAVNDPRGLAPAGYHIPTNAEWTVLTDYLGGSHIAGNKMKSTSGWVENGNGTNSSGFSGHPGGARGNTFGYIGKLGYWWSATEDVSGYAFYRNLYYYNDRVKRYVDNKGLGFSVRCLRD